MRPITLKLSGLHSFREEQVIDFDQLSELGIFGIFGPTGSGKSSILDGITLALYGTVGRAERGTQGILNHAEKSLSVSFTFSIGNGEKKKMYGVDRRYKRTNEFSVTNSYSRLWEWERESGKEVVLADRAGEVNLKIQQILGLKVEDFTRAVVLPQGKFMEFLHLKGKDRREMLQRLFSLERYGTVLANRLSDRYNQAERKVESIERYMQGLGDASQQALEEAELRWKQAMQTKAQALDWHNQVTQRHKEMEQIKDWQEECQGVQQQLQEHILQAPVIAEIGIRLERSARAEQIIPFLQRTERVQETVEAYRCQLAQIEEKLRQVGEECREASEQYEQTKKERVEQAPLLIAQTAKLEGLMAVEQEIEEMEEKLAHLEEALQLDRVRLTDNQQAIQQKSEEKVGLAAELQSRKRQGEAAQISPIERSRWQDVLGKEEAAKKAKKEWEEWTEEYRARCEQHDVAKKGHQAVLLDTEACEKEWLACQDKLKNANPPQDDPQQLSKQSIQLHQLLSQTEGLRDKEEESATLTRLLGQKDHALFAAEASHATAVQEEQVVLEQLSQLQQQYAELIMQDHQGMAAKLAQNLAKDCPCPVCGSLEHPNPVKPREDSSISDEEMSEWPGKIEEAERVLTGKRHIVQECSTQIIQLQTQRTGLAEQLDQMQKQTAHVRDQLFASLQEAFPEMEWRIDDTAEALLNRIGQQLARNGQKETEYAAWQKQLEQWKDEIEAKRDQLNDKKAILAGKQQQVESTQTEWEKAGQTRKAKEQAWQQALDLLHEALEQAGFESAQAMSTEYRRREDVVQACSERLKELEPLLQEIEESLQHLRTEETRLKLEMNSFEKDHVHWKEQTDRKRQNLFQVTAGKKVQELLGQVRRKLEALEESEEKAKKRYDRTEQEKGQTENKKTEISTLFDNTQKESIACQAELNRVLDKENFVSTQEVREALLAEEEAVVLRKQVQDHEDVGRKLRDRRAELEKKLQGRTLTEEQWQEVLSQLTKAKEKEQSATAAVGAAEQSYQDVQAKHEEWEKYEVERNGLSIEKDRLYLLRQVLRGTEFVEFLAQEQLQYVAAQASERLKQLTRNRYALETDAESGFIMRDDANGGVRRPVSTLSGGETFLTSLSLALSLSSQIQLRGQYPLEFFFLDEGFGTLDPELLDMVMNALEMLHMGQMTIGVISHVPELRQRMNRRLIVEPAEAGGGGTKVRLERG